MKDITDCFGDNSDDKKRILAIRRFSGSFLGVREYLNVIGNPHIAKQRERLGLSNSGDGNTIMKGINGTTIIEGSKEYYSVKDVETP